MAAASRLKRATPSMLLFLYQLGSAHAPTPRAAHARPGARRMRRALIQALDEHRLAHASGDAHRLDPVGAIHRPQPVEQRGHDPRARHAERVTERDRAAERFELVVRYA